MFAKKNLPLIIAFSLPVLMVIFVAASIYLPGIFMHPKYNFLYSVGEWSSGMSTYTVVQHKIMTIKQQNPSYPYETPRTVQLYVHNVTTNESSAISFEDAEKLQLDPTTESPDGYKVEDGNQSSGLFPFFWYDGNRSALYLTGHSGSKKLNLKTIGSSYENRPHFIGWIE